MPRKIDSFTGQYRFLSNFEELSYPIYCSMRLHYRTVENAYQASKSLYERDRIEIQRMPPAKAKVAGRRMQLRPDWEEIKRAVMMDLLLQKFINNVDLRNALQQTGNAILEEGNHWGDREWGTVNGTGKNYLGMLLMDVRDLLREE